MNRILSLFYLLLLASCTQVDTPKKTDIDTIAEREDNKDLANVIPVDPYGSNASKDTLYQLLDIAAKLDSFDFTQREPFLCMQSGYYFSPTTKSAILVYKVDTGANKKYRVEILTYIAPKDYTGPGKPKNPSWITVDVKTFDNFMLPQIGFSFKDYNFDGKTDIYLQQSVSNGIALSHGHLLIRNSKGGFTLHPESYELASMEPDKNKKVVMSLEYIDCAPNNQYPSGSVCKLTNQWKNGKLVTVKKECPCEEVNYP